MLPERNSQFRPMKNFKHRLNIQLNTSVANYLRLITNGPNWLVNFFFAHHISANSSTGTAPHEIVFSFKPHIPNSVRLGLVRDDNDLCHSEFCQSLPNHTHVNKKTSQTCIDILLSPKSLTDLLDRETQIMNKHRTVYWKVQEAIHRSLAYRNK